MVHLDLHNCPNMKKKTKKLIKALEARLVTVETRSILATDFINDFDCQNNHHFFLEKSFVTKW